MSENAKTIAFVAIGLVAVALALVGRPTSADLDVTTMVGRVLTEKFDSPDDAKRLKIVRFDEDTATLREFEIAEEDGLWTIPSKGGYPADAAEQMAEASLALNDVKIREVRSQDAADHEQYGVKDPLSSALKIGDKGVGTRVTLSDIDDEALVDLIIGKSVKDAEGQRYVREAERDVVYVVEVDPTKLSTKFDDWIEKDLLKLDAWDLKQVEIKDYSADLVADQFGLGIERDLRANMTLGYDDKASKWTAEKLQTGNSSTGEYTDFKLTDDEELDVEALNALKTALDDLKIVDVVRKPAGLSADLKAGDNFINDREAQLSLVTKGFTPAPTTEGGQPELISSNGEVIATMNDGAEYVLRFGNLTDADGEAHKDEAITDPLQAAAAADKSKSNVHRYLFVMARYNDDAVKKPELEEPPALPADGETAPADENAAEPAADAAAATSEGATTESTATTESAEPAADAASTDEKAAGPVADASTDANGKAAENADKPADKPAESASDAKPADKQSEVDRILAERAAIEARNQEKTKEYQEARERGRKKVDDLNLRFGDWYFVIDNNVFNKVRLGRDDVIKKKGAVDAASGDAAASPAGLPGTAIPGLPAIPGAGGTQ